MWKASFWWRYFLNLPLGQTLPLGDTFSPVLFIGSLEKLSMLALLKTALRFSKPTQHQSPTIFVSKRHNLAPKITINNDNQVLILSQEQSKNGGSIA